jgi:hypothetical protein
MKRETRTDLDILERQIKQTAAQLQAARSSSEHRHPDKIEVTLPYPLPTPFGVTAQRVTVDPPLIGACGPDCPMHEQVTRLQDRHIKLSQELQALRRAVVREGRELAAAQARGAQAATLGRKRKVAARRTDLTADAKRVTAKRYADEHGISVRTAQRDLRAARSK